MWWRQMHEYHYKQIPCQFYLASPWVVWVVWRESGERGVGRDFQVHLLHHLPTYIRRFGPVKNSCEIRQWMDLENQSYWSSVLASVRESSVESSFGRNGLKTIWFWLHRKKYQLQLYSPHLSIHHTCFIERFARCASMQYLSLWQTRPDQPDQPHHMLDHAIW